MRPLLSPKPYAVTTVENSLYRNDDDEGSSRRWIPWIAITALVLVLHGVTLLVHYNWSAPALPPRMPIQTVDPAKLESVRKQWRKREQSLLLNQDKSKPSEKEAPPDAKFFSDRNIRVEKEQRARETAILPKPGSPQAADTPTQEKPQPQRRAPTLGDLGVRFKLDQPAHKKSQSRIQNQRLAGAAGPQGGAQAIEDKQIPEGSENMLNAQESIFYSFYARVYEAVGPVWGGYAQQVTTTTRLIPGEYVTQVDVVLDRHGNLKRIDRLRSSGVAGFDQAVDSAWQRIQRFPNPPTELLNEEGEIHTGWTFTVHLGSGGSGLQLLPPARDY